MNSQSRRILTVLLLLLYGFIITPVALWHSHACDNTASCIGKLPASEKQVAKAGHSCLICEHAYTSFIATNDPQEEIHVTEYRPYSEIYCKGILSLVIPQCNTRGSPAVMVSFSLFV